MKATLIGTLDGRTFTQGVSVFPVLDNPVHLATTGDLDLIFDRGVESGTSLPDPNEPGFCIEIGESAIFDGYPIQIDPDALFGKHLAVLGSTGSGKSCTIASLVQSILSRPEIQRTNIVILDTNGEYRSAFQQKDNQGNWIDVGNRKTLYIPSDSREISQRLAIPYWFLNSEDFVRLFRASQGVQRPVLLDALRLARNEGAEKSTGQILREELIHEFNRIWSLSGRDEKTSKDVHEIAVGLMGRIVDQSFDKAWASFPDGASKDAVMAAIGVVKNEAEKHIEKNTYPKVFPADARAKIRDAIDPIFAKLTGAGLGQLSTAGGLSADTPAFFEKMQFRTRHIEQVLRREESGGARARDFSGTMLLRIDRLLADTRFDFLLGPTSGEFPRPEHGLATFLRDIMGVPSAESPQPALSDQKQVPPGSLPFYDRQRSGNQGHHIVILDLSLVKVANMDSDLLLHRNVPASYRKQFFPSAVAS